MWGWKSFDTERPFLNKNGFRNVWSETALEANAVNMGRARKARFKWYCVSENQLKQLITKTKTCLQKSNFERVWSHSDGKDR